MAGAEDWLDGDRAYQNGAFIAGAGDYPARWAEAAARFRGVQGRSAALDQIYGGHARQRFDLFLPDGVPRGLMVFIHGGYWRAFGRRDWSHLAGGALARGWACALPSYRLAPEVPITEITRDCTAAITAARAFVAGPVVVTGHSAGGHLSARMGCADGPEGVLRVVPISPLAELAPLAATLMQGELQISAAEMAQESPARLALRPGVQAHVWVGGGERPSFLWQGRVLAEAWGCPWTVDPGKHHFDVIDGMEDPASPLLAACLDGLGV